MAVEAIKAFQHGKALGSYIRAYVERKGIDFEPIDWNISEGGIPMYLGKLDVKSGTFDAKGNEHELTPRVKTTTREPHRTGHGARISRDAAWTTSRGTGMVAVAALTASALATV